MLPIIIGFLLLIASGSVFFIGPATNQDLYLTFQVDVKSSSQDLEDITTILERHDVKATFFVMSNWVHNNTNTTIHLADNYEIGCLGVNGTRLALLEEGVLREEILGCTNVLEELNISVHGFRAPHKDINQQAQKILLEHNLYDSSTLQRYTWFWEKTPNLVTHPISAAGLIPLDDSLFSVFRHNSPYYFLARQTRQSDVILAMNTKNVQAFELDYLIAFYSHHGATSKELQERSAWS